MMMQQGRVQNRALGHNLSRNLSHALNHRLFLQYHLLSLRYRG